MLGYGAKGDETVGCAVCVTVRQWGVNVCVSTCVCACDHVPLHSISVGEKEKAGEKERD